MRILGWAGVGVGLSGVLPGIFLLRGSMIEFGMVIVLLGGLLLMGVGVLEEMRQVRRTLARIALRGGTIPSGTAEPVHQGDDPLWDGGAVHPEAGLEGGDASFAAGRGDASFAAKRGGRC
jgi:hypothetical protein